MGSGGVSNETIIRFAGICRMPSTSLSLTRPLPTLDLCKTHTHHAPTQNMSLHPPEVGSSYRHIYTPAFRIFSVDFHGARAMYSSIS